VSKLKCLKCRWYWDSSRQYVDRIRDWTERSRKGLTDEDILARLIEGTLSVDIVKAEVYSGDRKLSVREADRGSRGRYRFVEICRNGKKKAIALHRIVWMAVTKRLIPDDKDIDHIRGSVAGDGISNLRCIPSSMNRSRSKMALADQSHY